MCYFFKLRGKRKENEREWEEEENKLYTIKHLRYIIGQL